MLKCIDIDCILSIFYYILPASSMTALAVNLLSVLSSCSSSCSTFRLELFFTGSREDYVVVKRCKRWWFSMTIWVFGWCAHHSNRYEPYLPRLVESRAKFGKANEVRECVLVLSGIVFQPFSALFVKRPKGNRTA
jgi:hypothetical protein